LIRVIVAAALIVLAGCQVEQPLLGGTVLDVTEIDLGLEPKDPAKYYEDPLVPEVAWQVEVQLDDGSAVTVPHNGTRRYEPGERVRLLVREDGRLLL
jgi:hypothetical protein